MGTKSVRLDESVYERITAHKQEGESFSEAIDRLTTEYSLLDFAGTYSAEEADRHRELLDCSEATQAAKRSEQLDFSTD